MPLVLLIQTDVYLSMPLLMSLGPELCLLLWIPGWCLVGVQVSCSLWLIRSSVYQQLFLGPFLCQQTVPSSKWVLMLCGTLPVVCGMHSPEPLHLGNAHAL